MRTHRIVLLSDTRPARTWRFVKRIRREIAGAQVCAIVQAVPEEHSNAKRQFQSRSARLVHCALWWIHGCPTGLRSRSFSEEDLIKKCREVGTPVLTTNNLADSNVLKFVTDRKPDLMILLGASTLDSQLLNLPDCGTLSAIQNVLQGEPNKSGAITIKTEAFGHRLECPCTVAQLVLPTQPYDSEIGLRLKTDLIADDLMLQSAAHLLTNGEDEAAQATKGWTREMYSPYLEQLQECRTRETTYNLVRHRSMWKLCLDSLLLCSPIIVGRNWYRRLRCQYPVTILTHHLVSDRPHRMGIPTETFWRQVRFLQRHYRIISLGEAVELLKSGRVDCPTLVLTFDDGYADNFVSLRAVAEETGVPVTLFVATQQVEEQKEFQHDVENGISGFLPLTWQQVRYWSTGSVEFGAHTRTHFDCSIKERAKLEYEVLGSKTDLERHIGMLVGFFAFPFGQQENMSREAVEIATRSYNYYVSGYGGENSCRTRKDNQHLLRKNLYANAWEQELDLQSVFDLADRIKRRLRRCWPRAYDAPLGAHPASASM